MKNAGKACNNRLYRHIRTFEKIVKNYFVIYAKYVYKVIYLENFRKILFCVEKDILILSTKKMSYEQKTH